MSRPAPLRRTHTDPPAAGAGRKAALAVGITQGAGAALSLKQLRYLVALSDTLNFTRAADRCFVTQSTLSAGIRELEQQLDVVLFERDRQSVRPTTVGQELAERARALLSQGQDFVLAARSSGDVLQGTVTLGAIPTIAPFLLPPLLRRLRRELPALSVLLREEQTDRLLQELDEGTIDMALIALPMDVGRMRVVPLFDEELWLIAAEDDPLLRAPMPRVAQLDMERLMLLADGHCLREHSLQACAHGRRRRDRLPSAIEATSLPTLVQMVEAGLGVSLLPEMAVKAGFLVGSKVIARPLAAPAPKRQIALVARPTSSRGVLLDRIQALAMACWLDGAGRGARRSRVVGRMAEEIGSGAVAGAGQPEAKKKC
jgi:LysR family hydrogen peroxide-inducible transcriptional activator